MDLTAARAALAALLNAVPGAGLAVRAAPPVPAARTGDGWVVVRRLEPGPRFGPGVLATLQVPIVAGHDEASAEAFASAHSVAILRAVLHDGDLGAGQVSVEPSILVAGTNQAPQYALVLTATIETE